MSTNTEIVIVVFSGFIALSFFAVGLMMHHFDFSCMFQHPFDSHKEGLFLRVNGSLKKIAEATPENKRKFSNALGKIFISIGASIFLLFAYYVARLLK